MSSVFVPLWNLILDLDLTVIHADGHQCPVINRPMEIRAREGVKELFRATHDLRGLIWVNTHGTLLYAKHVLQLLDPECKYLDVQRLKSRGDQEHQCQFKDLDSFIHFNHDLPMVIIDDNPLVWRKDLQPLVLQIPPFEYFASGHPEHLIRQQCIQLSQGLPNPTCSFNTHILKAFGRSYHETDVVLNRFTKEITRWIQQLISLHQESDPHKKQWLYHNLYSLRIGCAGKSSCRETISLHQRLKPQVVIKEQPHSHDPICTAGCDQWICKDCRIKCTCFQCTDDREFASSFHCGKAACKQALYNSHHICEFCTNRICSQWFEMQRCSNCKQVHCQNCSVICGYCEQQLICIGCGEDSEDLGGDGSLTCVDCIKSMKLQHTFVNL